MSWRTFRVDTNNNEAAISQDPFPGSGMALKVFLPTLGRDVWLCADEEARTMVESEGLTCLLFPDLQYILNGIPGEERSILLQKVFARRHPVTDEVLKQFNGRISKIEILGD